ncbi:unnamed protein product [Microthlaspi erraticum]|uniref:RING-type E3 ubiquitin transferase n=1 Tax=Microthlaspi erraticum TaxID=1685480 RepID=A0A6D2KTJ0_9BRAS|nr:unnamed protein product [Microthlaspi erraticum]
MGLGNSTSQITSGGNSSISSPSRSSNGENDAANSSEMLLDLEALSCPICCDALTSTIFQCENGHLACRTCCNKLRNKFPYCDLPVGRIRCRAMERVIKAVIVPCPNAKLGCTKSFSYGKEIIHGKECVFYLCSCPAKNCSYSGSYKKLYNHFQTHENERGCSYRFIAGESREVYFELTEYNSVFMSEYEAGLLSIVCGSVFQ